MIQCFGSQELITRLRGSQSIIFASTQPIGARGASALAASVAATIVALLFIVRVELVTFMMPSVVVFELVVLYLGVVAGCDDYDEHKKDKNDHDVHADLVRHLYFA